MIALMRIAARVTCVAFAAGLALTGTASADDWVASKLRGQVFAWDGAEWNRLARGSVVDDTMIIRTGRNGRVEFRRDELQVQMSPGSQIRIYDRWNGDMTVIQEHFGTVSADVDHRKVKHFAIQTRFLVASVKGTHFSVTTSDDSAAVHVERGKVEVSDTERSLRVNVTPGQVARAGKSHRLTIAGHGDLEKVVRVLPNGKTVEVPAHAGKKGKGHAKADKAKNKADNKADKEKKDKAEKADKDKDKSKKDKDKDKKAKKKDHHHHSKHDDDDDDD